MGLTIHYRGKIDNIEAVPTMLEELQDIAKAMHWEYSTLDEDWDAPAEAKLTHADGKAIIEGELGLKGISFSPAENCETFSFYMDRTGHLRSVIDMLMIIEGSIEPEKSWISVKTQFAGPETHAWMVGLLKYLKNKYISNLEVSDEGDYWETENIDTLRQKMNFINDKLNEITGKLERDLKLTDLSSGSIADAIERILNDD